MRDLSPGPSSRRSDADGRREHLGKLLRIACSRLPTSLDREQREGLLQVENKDAHLQVYEPLLTYPGVTSGERMVAGDLIPLAAEDWSHSSDGAVHRVSLRRGVWSPFGNELKARDVVWTWGRSMALGTVGAWVISRAGVRSPSQVHAVSDYEVEFRLTQPSSLLPHLLAVMVPAIFDSTEVRRHTTPADEWALNWLRLHSAGYGPYTIASVDDRHMRFEANPGYWGGRPGYDELEFSAFAQPQDRLDALLAGSVDIALDIEASAGDHGSVIVRSLPTAWRVALALNCSIPPFDRPEARRAIAKAIPYDGVVNEALGGRASRMGGCVPDIVWGATTDVPHLDYDPVSAAEYFSAFSPSADVRLLFHAGVPGAAQIAALVTSSLIKVGVAATPIEVSETDHDNAKLGHTYEMVLDHFGPQVMDARYALGHDVNAPLGGVFDITGFHDPVIENDLRAAETSMEKDNVLTLVARVQQRAMHALPWIPLAQYHFTVGLSKSVTGYRWYPLPRIRVRDLAPA